MVQKDVTMPKTANINARVEKDLKTKAEKVLRHVGVKTSDAITMFLRQVVLQRGLPFDVRVPNAETRKAIAELENPAKLKSYTTTKDLFDDALGKKLKRKA
jgi:DNA-damage-inducible protein J